jgi:hypothetical protein
MFITQGGVGVASFDVALGGAVSGVGTASATVYRNGAIEAVATTVSSDTTGHYSVSFIVPNSWIEHDIAEIRFILNYSGVDIACTKSVGVVTSVGDITKLLTADQVRVGNKIFYYEAGTSQSVLLFEQDIAGTSACAGDVSLTS